LHNPAEKADQSVKLPAPSVLQKKIGKRKNVCDWECAFKFMSESGDHAHRFSGAGQTNKQMHKRAQWKSLFCQGVAG